jgi:hypothetical protein
MRILNIVFLIRLPLDIAIQELSVTHLQIYFTNFPTLCYVLQFELPIYQVMFAVPSAVYIFHKSGIFLIRDNLEELLT